MTVYASLIHFDVGQKSRVSQMPASNGFLVIFDLDQTAICAMSGKPQNISKDYGEPFTIDESLYTVYVRPGVRELIDWIYAQGFKVGVWTAATLAYGTAVTQQVFLKDHPERQVSPILCSYHCDISERQFRGVKDLNFLFGLPRGLLEFDCTPDNTVIIDDLDEVLEINPRNCIGIKGFWVSGGRKTSPECRECDRVKGILARIRQDGSVQRVIPTIDQPSASSRVEEESSQTR